MPDSWTKALNLYCYPVDLGGYNRQHEFPGFFEILIAGDRSSTIAFENHFREAAPDHIVAFFEVVFWKLYSLPLVRQGSTDRIVNDVLEHNIQAGDLWDAVSQFIKNQTINNYLMIRELLGLRSDVLAIPLTFPALVDPERVPMIDMQVARWVNLNRFEQNANINNQLRPFKLNYTSLRKNDFVSYLNWVNWCREISEVLTRITNDKWRARDVEMAVFTAQRNSLILNPLVGL